VSVVPLRSRLDRTGHPSLRAAIYDALRDEILEGRLEPGNLLSIKDVQGRFGVSASAVREALCQLASGGLVLAEEQRGFRVAPVSAADLEDVTRSRAELEMFTIRDAIANGDVEWESQLLAAFHKLTKLPKRSADYAREHQAFHDLLVAPCRSEWMKRFRKTLQEHSDRYRRLATNHNDDGRDIDGEHGDLVKAALDRDGDRAALLISEHVHRTARILARHGLTE
jgi:GntR family carbon starvation induced transcriptional regulator